MSFKTFIEAIVAFFKAIFGGKSTTTAQQTTTQQTTAKPIHPSVGIIDPVEFSFHFGKYSVEDQIKIRNTINENAANGIKNYTIDMPDRIYRIVNGGQILESTEGKTKKQESQ